MMTDKAMLATARDLLDFDARRDRATLKETDHELMVAAWLAAYDARASLGHWSLMHYARPMSLNDYRTKHWRKHQEHELEWRKAGAMLALEAKLPKGLARVRFEAFGFGPGSQQDPGNCYPSVKAMIDGLVDAGVIADDDGTHVASITLLPWVAKGKQSGLELHIYEVTP